MRDNLYYFQEGPIVRAVDDYWGHWTWWSYLVTPFTE